MASILRVVRPSPLEYISYSLESQQSRARLIRSSLPATRLSSTVAKQPTLKERLAELIPAEIENASDSIHLLCVC